MLSRLTLTRRAIKEKIIPRGRFYPRKNKYKKNSIIIKTITKQVGFAETL
jgi:hypothetical protein